MRKIIHVDMDCFYAAVEMRENPSLVGKPIAVGGGEPRSVVATCNYEARAFGVRSAMSGFTARKLCPSITFLTVRRKLYEKVSAQIRAIFDEYTPLVEPLSLDEAYLDVTESERLACDIAEEIRARIYEETKLTASAGIAENKMLAKIASDWHKPNGQHEILSAQVADFMISLPIRKVPGIGAETAKDLSASHLHTCGELQKLTLHQLTAKFGKRGADIFHRCRGVDEREVEPNKLRKSLRNEKTFLKDLMTFRECEAAVAESAKELLDQVELRFSDRRIHTAFVTLKFSDLTTTTKQRACVRPCESVFHELLADAYERSFQPVRLLGTGVQFVEVKENDDRQQELFS